MFKDIFNYYYVKIKKHSHAELDSVSNISNKRGAMFGLDARIALAIFGALSVITGAALYSSIKETNIISIITEVNEVEKAISQYMLDTGTNLESVLNDDTLKGQALVENANNVKGWKGPYLSYDKQNTLCLKGFKEKNTCIEAYRPAPFAAWIQSNRICQKASKNCYYWIYISGQNLDFLKQLETRIDKTENPGDENLDGNFIYSKTSSAGSFKTSIPYPTEISAN